jgi:glyoxylase-like metal-dependent hydrolase (beta-lactamase superfamily II)
MIPLTTPSEVQEGFSLTKPGSHHVFPPLPDAALPTISADDGLTPTVGDIAAQVRHFSEAHTDGDLAVYIPDQGVAVVGELVWPGTFPFIDTPTGGTATGLVDALNDLLEWIAPGTRVVPGHGEVMTYDALVEYRDFVLAAIEAAAFGPSRAGA